MVKLGFWRRLVSIALLFVLLSEWMRPLAMMSDVTGIYLLGPFLITIAAAMAVDLLQLPAVLAWTIKAMAILSLPATIYGQTHLADMAWWAAILPKFADDLLHMVRLDWEMVSPETRTFLFILSWVIIASCLLTAVLYKRFALWLTAATAAYLLLLGWWPGLDTFPGMLRSVGAGMLLHAVHVPLVLLRANGLRIAPTRIPATWPLTAAALVLLSVGTGYAAAERLGEAPPVRSAAAWNEFDLLGRLGAKDIAGRSSGAGRTGYGPDDTRLGGALRTDEAPAFLAVAPASAAYYRGESKAVYDGKGWHDRKNALTRYDLHAALPNLGRPAGAQEAQAYIFLMDDEWLARLHAEELIDESAWRISSLKGMKGYSPIFAGGPLSRLTAARASSMDQIEHGFIAVDRLEGNYWIGGLKEPLASYGMAIVDSAEQAAADLSEAQALTGEELEAMLQLPEQLPDRVRRLSADIVQPYATDEEKARAIEAYLKQHYTYTLAPPEPRRGGSADFVDRFLFEQQAGYCDYFSTAMVVMLRAAGIPARWVKGFAAGEPLSATEHALIAERIAVIEPEAIGDAGAGAMSISLVRSSDAHSWVEAYLPGRGWTTFEPTPGFGDVRLEAMPHDEEAVPVMARPSAPERDTRLEASAADREPLGRIVDRARRMSKPFIAGIDRVLRDSRQPAYWMAGGIAGAAACLLAALWLLLRRPAARLRLRLALYACGIGGAGADARLLERMLLHTIGSVRADRPPEATPGATPGATYRECMNALLETDDSPDKAHIAGAIGLYERLCYGPEQHGRMPAGQLLALWRGLRK